MHYLKSSDTLVKNLLNMKVKTMKLKKIMSVLATLLILSSSVAFSSTADAEDNFLPESQNDYIFTTLPSNGNLRVNYIDVGQGDSEFIEFPNGETMLIDAGTNESGQTVVNYIKSLGYTSVDYVIGTHPHEDHIGGLDDVINSFDIGKIYMPKVTTDTKTFEDVLDAVENKNLTINTAKSGVVITETDDFSVKIVAPVSEQYDDLNNYSAVVKVSYKDNSFLFTGDAEELSENQITDDISADVLKAGHHGSSTSSSDKFLDRVCPSTVVISCGEDNSYGHPHKETIENLNSRNIKYYRTDINGTVVATSDGSTITFTTDKSTSTVQTENKTETEKNYVLNTNSKKIHLPSCPSVSKMSDKNKSFTSDYNKAISEGYTPCASCNP